MDFFNLLNFAILVISAWEINKGVKTQNTAKVIANIFYFIVLSLFFVALP